MALTISEALYGELVDLGYTGSLSDLQYALLTDDNPPVGGGGTGAVDSVNSQTGDVLLDQDDIPDGLLAKQYSQTEKTKLAGIATGATANDTDANLKNRANHTGTQTSSTISDLTETVQDIVGAFLAEGTGITVTYDDAGNVLTITAIGGGGTWDAEETRDTIGAALIGAGLIDVVVNDAGDTITITTTATANDTDANLKNRANHTGTQDADTITDGTANKVYTATEKTKLSGIAAGATVNDTDANLKARANHTGTQSADTIVDGTTNKAYTSAEKTKLGGIASGATANSSDATLLARANHTGTQSTDTLTDGTTSKVYTATEKTKLAGIDTGATANSTDAALKNRANHTGTQDADTITDGTTNKVYTATEKTKLGGIASGATANDTDANLKARANHTGTQTASTISDFNTSVDARITGKADLASPTFTGTVTLPNINRTGSARETTTSRTSAFTLTTSSPRLQLCAPSASFNVTLPSTTTPDILFTFVKTDTDTTKTVTLLGTFDGLTNIVMRGIRQRVTVATTTTADVFKIIEATEVVVPSGTSHANLPDGVQFTEYTP